MQPAFVFVFPSVLNGRLFDGFDYHLGTGHLRAYLAACEVPTAQFLGGAGMRVAEAARAILAVDAEMIGFSCYDSNYHLIRLLAEEIRRLAPTVPIVCGGPSATFSAELMMSDCSAIDICCRSYAEETALELVNWSRGKRSLDDILGITFRNSHGVRHNPDRPMPRARGASSIPAAFLKAQDTYIENGGALDKYPNPYVAGLLPAERVSDIGLVTSRGCTFACTFCNFSAMADWGIATHSIEYQIEVFRFLERDLLRSGKRTLVTINDDNFSLQGRRFHELLSRMEAEAFKNLSFWAEMRTETMKEQTFPLLRRAGFVEINFGLESASPRVLAAMKKVRSKGWEKDNYEKERRFLDRVEWAVGRARSEGIRTTVSTIFGGPTETEADGFLTLTFIEKIEVDSYAHNYLVVGDGTELANTFASFGLTNENPPDKVLPPITRMTYDVYKLPILDHDRSWLPTTGFEMRQTAHLFSGVRDLPSRQPRPRGNGRGGMGRAPDENIGSTQFNVPGPLVGLMSRGTDEHVAQWLSANIPMNAAIWLEIEEFSDKRPIQRILNQGAVPVLELNILRPVQDGTGKVAYRVNEFSSSAPSYNTRMLHRLPLANVVDVEGELPRCDKRHALLLTLDGPAELEKVVESIPEPTQLAEWVVEESVLSARPIVQDGCRWCSSECPSTKVERLFVAENRSIRPCPGGGAIGRVGQSLTQLAEQAAAIEASVRSERGCDTCVANSTCAKCIFPGEISVEQYCLIQRTRPSISGLVDGLTVVKSLVEDDLVGLAEGACRITSLHGVAGELKSQDKSIPLQGCVLLTFQSKAFVYNHKQSFLARLSTDGAEALRALSIHSGEQS